MIVTEVYSWCKSGAKGAKVSLVKDPEVQKVQRNLRNAPVLNQFILLPYSTLNLKGAKVQEKPSK
jgi:hypothetical protein